MEKISFTRSENKELMSAVNYNKMVPFSKQVINSRGKPRKTGAVIVYPGRSTPIWFGNWNKAYAFFNKK